MGPNFLTCDRDQVLLLPPSLREWLPEGHLAWFVIDAVEQMDLTAFYGAYRLDGQGRAAHEPSMMDRRYLVAGPPGVSDDEGHTLARRRNQGLLAVLGVKQRREVRRLTPPPSRQAAGCLMASGLAKEGDVRASTAFKRLLRLPGGVDRRRGVSRRRGS